MVPLQVRNSDSGKILPSLLKNPSSSFSKYGVLGYITAVKRAFGTPNKKNYVVWSPENHNVMMPCKKTHMEPRSWMSRSKFTQVMDLTFHGRASPPRPLVHGERRRWHLYRVLGKFLLKKFHLGKFHLENSSYGKFLLRCFGAGSLRSR